MKNKIKMLGIIAIAVIIGFAMAACDNGNNFAPPDTTTPPGGDPVTTPPTYNTTALEAALNEAWNARYDVKTAIVASDVVVGKFWVTKAEWDIFDTAIKTAEAVKVKPSSQSAVDTAKTDLEAAIIIFNAAKKNGTDTNIITLSGTITITNNGQPVPFVQITAHSTGEDGWIVSEGIRISSSAPNSSWSIIMKPLSSPTDLVFEVCGFNNEKYDKKLFSIDLDILSQQVYNTDISNININRNLNLITISGTFSYNFNGSPIPSVQIDLQRKDDGQKLGDAIMQQAGNNTQWSTTIQTQAPGTDISLYIAGFDGPVPHSTYDELFHFFIWDSGIQIGNQDVSGVVLKYVKVSGTFELDYGQSIPSVDITIVRKDNDMRLGNVEIKQAGSYNEWSGVFNAPDTDTDVSFNIVGFNGPSWEAGWEDTRFFAFWGMDFGVKIGSQSKTGIALKFIKLEGTINVTYNGGNTVSRASIQVFINDDWHSTTDLRNPSANAPWSIVMKSFDINTDIHIGVFCFDDQDDFISGWGEDDPLTVRNQNIYGISLNLGEIEYGGGGGYDNDMTGWESAILLAANGWTDASLSFSNERHWYKISVTAGTTYYFWMNDSFKGDGSKTVDVLMDAYYSDSEGDFDYVFSADDYYDSPYDFTANRNSVVFIRVKAYNNDDVGDYGIAYNTTGIRP
jgi:hypothetical protein